MPSLPRAHLLICLPPSLVFRNSLLARAFSLQARKTVALRITVPKANIFGLFRVVVQFGFNLERGLVFGLPGKGWLGGRV